MNERQVERRERQIVPAWSKRRCKQHHAAFARATFNERRTAIFKPREHGSVRARLGTEVTDDISSSESAALLKHFEDRMIELHFGDRNSLARLWSALLRASVAGVMRCSA